MNLNYLQLQRPEYLFAKGYRSAGAFQGLRSAGPYSYGDCPVEPSVLFVYPKELKQEARKLYLSLRDGIGPFKGTNALLRFQLPAQRVKLLDNFLLPTTGHHDAAKAYAKAIAEWLASTDERPDIALILHPKTDSDNDENPYLTSKFPLLKAGIPSQIVTPELLAKNELFQWSAATIALAMFAKMGGEPWAIASQLSEDTIIVGINRATVLSREVGRPARYFGFASTFSHNGIYLGTKLFKPADTRPAYLQGLRLALRETLASWRDQAGGSPANLVIHVRKEISREETDIIHDVLSEADAREVRSFAILKLTESEHALIADPAQRDAQLPPPGVLVRLTGHRGILQVTGVDEQERAQGRIVTHPLQVRLLRNSEGAPRFVDLSTHVLAMAAMNWRALNAEASPVSTKYPQLVANLLGRFTEAGFDVEELSGLPVMQRPWFL